MDIYTVSLFGHREINDLRQLHDQLDSMIWEYIQTKPYVVFLIGRNGEFDEYAASLIKLVQKGLGKENCEINLVLPYTVANLEYYENYYDNVIIPESMHNVHPKFAITLRNQWMIEQSDLVLVYVEHDRGGAYAAMKYAKKKSKEVINLCIKNSPF